MDPADRNATCCITELLLQNTIQAIGHIHVHLCYTSTLATNPGTVWQNRTLINSNEVVTVDFSDAGGRTEAKVRLASQAVNAGSSSAWQGNAYMPAQIPYSLCEQGGSALGDLYFVFLSPLSNPFWFFSAAGDGEARLRSNRHAVSSKAKTETMGEQPGESEKHIVRDVKRNHSCVSLFGWACGSTEI